MLAGYILRGINDAVGAIASQLFLKQHSILSRLYRKPILPFSRLIKDDLSIRPSLLAKFREIIPRNPCYGAGFFLELGLRILKKNWVAFSWNFTSRKLRRVLKRYKREADSSRHGRP